MLVLSINLTNSSINCTTMTQSVGAVEKKSDFGRFKQIIISSLSKKSLVDYKR